MRKRDDDIKPIKVAVCDNGVRRCGLQLQWVSFELWQLHEPPSIVVCSEQPPKAPFYASST
ncbi:hypothetical protein DEO72_LG5g3222 [Vigna unguiculata]|uniref:Uncharacterized protein n=1 Tax=Vigna unguiculata TaxID=3917 RepID=A0A4D6M1I7_VIGUN|nr:hypothetical protein DEO72_LG5g3222 [Vigna unguiculata]